MEVKISFWLETYQKEALQEMAKKQQLSTSAYLRLLVDNAIKNNLNNNKENEKMTALKNYLKHIQETENLHGKTDTETRRAVLCKYFNGYTFENDKDATDFFLCFNEETDNNMSFTRKMIFPYAANILGRNYNVVAEMDGLTIKIKPRANVYSYNPIEGWHEGYDPFLLDEEPIYGNTLEEALATRSAN